jgi:undecaprenyl-diphosphatase
MKEGATLGGMAILSGVVAGIFAYLSLTLLMRYFNRHEFEAMSPFAYYCWAAGVISLGIIAFV